MLLFRSLAGIALLPVLGSACVPDVEPGASTPQRCDQVAPTCGRGAAESCCAAGKVVGGTFDRLNNAAYPATVSDFHLDRFEVTVGRFRQFVASYPAAKPAAGAGAHPLIDGSGWDPAWDPELPSSREALIAELQCDANFRTWTDEPSSNESAPINCVSWYVAFAFCAWDEGRLPTDAEWNYAAAGGNEHREHPWGPAAPSDDLAVFGCETTTTVCPLPRVGSRSPAGDGKWKQADLAGSVFEWVFDYHNEPVTPCDNCASLTEGEFGRGAYGGAFSHGAETLSTAYRIGEQPELRYSFFGFRCARDE